MSVNTLFSARTEGYDSDSDTDSDDGKFYEDYGGDDAWLNDGEDPKLAREVGGGCEECRSALEKAWVAEGEAAGETALAAVGGGLEGEAEEDEWSWDDGTEAGAVAKKAPHGTSPAAVESLPNKVMKEAPKKIADLVAQFVTGAKEGEKDK